MRDEYSWAIDQRRSFVRFVVCAAAAAVVCLALWQLVPQELANDTNIVGYPTFHNFNFERPFWAYRLLVYVFPLLTFGCYVLLRRTGPLRLAPTLVRPGSTSLLSPRPAEADSQGFRVGVIPRLAIATGVVLICAASRNGQIDRFAAAIGAAYLLAVAAAAGLLSLFISRTRRDTRAATYWQCVAWVNGAGGATAAMLGLWYVSRHTASLTDGGQRHAWPWMPWWLAAAGVVLVLYWTVRQFRVGRPAEAAELSLLTVVVGASGLFLCLSGLPGLVDNLFYLDPAQDVTGAGLLSRGYFPWRDFLFIHGLFPDALRASLGLAVFGGTGWGAYAGVTVVLAPLMWVILYLFGVWATRRNPWFAALVAIGIVGVLVPLQFPVGIAADVALQRSTTFLAVPLVFMIFGAALRRRSRAWLAGLAVVLFALGILVPETMFLAVSVVACVIGADLVHRESGASLWRALWRTRWCVGAGGFALVLFALFLAWHGALGSFVDYFRVFGPGHAAAGAFPLSGEATSTGDPAIQRVMLLVSIAPVLATFWASARRILRRAAWEPLDWVELAAAGWVALYAEKAIGRFDMYHVWQVFCVALPLILLWLWKLAQAAGHWSGRRSVMRSGRNFPITNTVIASGLAIVMVLSAGSLQETAQSLGARHWQQGLPQSVETFGYAVDRTHLMKDIDAVLRAYAGDNEPVFDMSNNLGIFYYALGRDAGTRFVHLSMAIPPYAQRVLINELQRSRPPVVVFHSFHPAGPDWDDIGVEVRHYLVSRFILDGWVPVVRTHGFLMLVRRDLVDRTLPVPVLSENPQTTDLWFSIRGCNWGASPNFIRSVGSGPSMELPVHPVGEQVVVKASGTTAGDGGHKPAAVVVASGSRAVATQTLAVERSGATSSENSAPSPIEFHISGMIEKEGPLGIYLLADDGLLHPVTGSPRNEATAIEFPDGRIIATTGSEAGEITKLSTSTRTVSRIDFPADVKLTDYDLVTMSAGGVPIGGSGVLLTDGAALDGRTISAVSLPGADPRLAIRVGSCLQWHGYDPARPLFVAQDGGAPVTSVTLSGTSD